MKRRAQRLTLSTRSLLASRLTRLLFLVVVVGSTPATLDGQEPLLSPDTSALTRSHYDPVGVAPYGSRRDALDQDPQRPVPWDRRDQRRTGVWIGAGVGVVAFTAFALGVDRCDIDCISFGEYAAVFSISTATFAGLGWLVGRQVERPPGVGESLPNSK